LDVLERELQKKQKLVKCNNKNQMKMMLILGVLLEDDKKFHTYEIFDILVKTILLPNPPKKMLFFMKVKHKTEKQ
jgi:hypothetical protein